MEDLIIDVGEIEELQMISNTDALDAIFYKAKKTVVSGGLVALVRRSREGKEDRFDELTTEEALADYKKGVYKYLA